jgi:hypothetical protein
MTHHGLPDLPSDEELGIAGLDEEELVRESGDHPPASPPPADPPPPGRPPRDFNPGVRESTPGGRGSWALGLATLLVLLTGAWGSSENRALPGTVAANAPDTAFSSGRAMARLVELARAPRPVGSPEHTRARELIMGWLHELGLEPEVHTSVALGRRGQAVQGVTIRNVAARIPGAASTGAVLLTAHYDAVPLSHGAGDAGTGVVAIVETVRALQSGPPLENDVIVLITDGEELGLLGARAFVAEHRWMDDLSVVLSAEMRGGGGPVHMFETGADNGWIVRAMQASDPRPFAGSFSVEIYRRLPNDTDFTPFRQAGIQGLNFAAIGRARVYHQPTDVPANIQEETIQHLGMRLLAMTRELGTRDLSLVNAPDLVYVTLPVLGIVAYPRGMALPISAGILLLWVGVALLARVRGARWAGVGAGVGVVVLSATVAGLIGWGLMRWLPRFHPEFGSMTPAFYGEGWYMLGLVAGALAVALGLLGVARRFFGPAALASGALLMAVLGALVTAAVAPLTALAFQLPAVAGTLAAGLLALGGGARGSRTRNATPGEPAGGGTASAPSGAGGPATWARVGALLLALPVLALMVPLVEGIWVAMSLRLAVVMGVLVVLALACLLPALDGLGVPNRWWAPTTALAAAILMVGAGILRAGPSQDRPLPSTLLHALDRESGEAIWASREDPGFAWVQEQVGPFGEATTLEAFLLPGPYRTAPAAAAEVPEPTAQFEGEVPGPLVRVVRISVASEAGAEILSVLLPDGAGGGVVAVEGRRVPEGPEGSPGARHAVTRITHQGVPRARLVMDVEVGSQEEELELVVVEEHLRPARYLGEEPFRRPPHLMPSPLGRSDRLLVRTPVRLSLGTPPEAGERGEGVEEEPPPPGTPPVPGPP